MTEQKKDTKELSELVAFVVACANLGIEIGKDKKVDLKDLSTLVLKTPGLIAQGAAAFQGMKEFDDELKDLTADEVAQLVALVALKLELDDAAKVKKIVVQSLKVASEVYALVKVILEKVEVQPQVEQPQVEQPQPAPAETI